MLGILQQNAFKDAKQETKFPFLATTVDQDDTDSGCAAG